MTPFDWIFLDLDGTLLRTDKSVSDFTVATLEAVRALGHRLVFVTARPPRAVRRLLPASFHGERFLCGNGARATRGVHAVFEASIPWPRVDALLEALVQADPGVRVAFEAHDALTANGDFGQFSPADAYTRVRSLAAFGSPVNKILVIVDAETRAAVEALVPPDLSRVVTDGGTLLQIMPSGISKGSAVRRLWESEGRGGGEALCFGDDLNDVALFEVCSLPVALENSVEALKALARESTGSNDEDGVAHFLSRRYLGARP